MKSVGMRLDVPWVNSVDNFDADPDELPDFEYVLGTRTRRRIPR